MGSLQRIEPGKSPSAQTSGGSKSALGKNLTARRIGECYKGC
jgi:hypothetical protein